VTCNLAKRLLAAGLVAVIALGAGGCYTETAPEPADAPKPDPGKTAEPAQADTIGPTQTDAAPPEPAEKTDSKYLDQENAPRGEGWIALCNGRDLEGWHPRQEDRPTSWKVASGVMVNTTSRSKRGTNIVTDQKFRDFEIYCEYRIPKGSSSGVFLRGRYEIQIADDHGRRPSSRGSGALYGLSSPAKNASRRAGQWQSLYARIAGRKVTIVLNGVKTVDNAEARRPTSGHLDNNVDQPGPIMIQGDRGAIEVRHLMLKPIEG